MPFDQILPIVITTVHSRFPVIGENKDVMEKISNVSRSAHTLTSTKAREDILSSALKGNVKGVMEQLFKNGLYRLDAKAYTDPIFLKRMNEMAKAQNGKTLYNRTNLLLKSPVFRHLSRENEKTKESEKKQKKLHIMMTPNRAYQIN